MAERGIMKKSVVISCLGHLFIILLTFVTVSSRHVPKPLPAIDVSVVMNKKKLSKPTASGKKLLSKKRKRPAPSDGQLVPQPKKPEVKKPEVKKSEPKKPEPKKSEEKKPEPKKSEEKKPEPKKPKVKKPEPKKPEPKKPEVKKAEIKKTNPTKKTTKPKTSAKATKKSVKKTIKPKTSAKSMPKKRSSVLKNKAKAFNMDDIENFLSDDETKSTALMSINALQAQVQGQLERCWNPPIDVPGAPDLSVEMDLNLNPDGHVNTHKITALNRDKNFQSLATERAISALNHPLCQRFNLPVKQYNEWRHIKLRFDPRAMF
jgi:flagellar biosynthesis GTPase FlhF